MRAFTFQFHFMVAVEDFARTKTIIHDGVIIYSICDSSVEKQGYKDKLFVGASIRVLDPWFDSFLVFARY